MFLHTSVNMCKYILHFLFLCAYIIDRFQVTRLLTGYNYNIYRRIQTQILFFAQAIQYLCNGKIMQSDSSKLGIVLRLAPEYEVRS